jgi:hypothetical protein
LYHQLNQTWHVLWCKYNYKPPTKNQVNQTQNFLVLGFDKVCQWLATGQWFSPDTVSSTNKTDSQDITEIFLKVALNTITLTLRSFEFGWLGFLWGVCNYTCIKVHVKFDLAGDTNLILFLNFQSLVSEWLLFNAKWGSFQLYHREN